MTRIEMPARAHPTRCKVASRAPFIVSTPKILLKLFVLLELDHAMLIS